MDASVNNQKVDLESPKLNQIILLGSHDAASYGIVSMAKPCIGEIKAGDTTNLIENPDIARIAPSFSKAQTSNLYGQLTAGVRYLDLRVCYQDNAYYASHGFIADKYDDLFFQINQFIKENPNAIIILDVNNHLYSEDNGHMSGDELEKFEQYFISGLKNNYIPSSYSTNLLMSNLESSQKNIILFTSNSTLLSEYPDVFWDRKQLLISDWGNKPNIKDLLPYLSQDINSWSREALNDKVRVLQAQITPPSNAAIATYLADPLYYRANRTNKAIYSALISNTWDN